MTIEQRLEALEQSVQDGTRQIRRWRTFAIGSSMVLLSICALGANEASNDIPHVIRARSFEVVADNGAVLARLGQMKGDGSLALYGPDGRTDFEVSMTSSGERIFLVNQSRRLYRLATEEASIWEGLTLPDRGDTPD